MLNVLIPNEINSVHLVVERAFTLLQVDNGTADTLKHIFRHQTNLEALKMRYLRTHYSILLGKFYKFHIVETESLLNSARVYVQLFFMSGRVPDSEKKNMLQHSNDTFSVVAQCMCLKNDDSTWALSDINLPEYTPS